MRRSSGLVSVPPLVLPSPSQPHSRPFCPPLSSSPSSPATSSHQRHAPHQTAPAFFVPSFLPRRAVNASVRRPAGLCVELPPRSPPSFVAFTSRVRVFSLCCCPLPRHIARAFFFAFFFPFPSRSALVSATAFSSRAPRRPVCPTFSKCLPAPPAQAPASGPFCPACPPPAVCLYPPLLLPRFPCFLAVLLGSIPRRAATPCALRSTPTASRSGAAIGPREASLGNRGHGRGPFSGGSQRPPRGPGAAAIFTGSP